MVQWFILKGPSLHQKGLSMMRFSGSGFIKLIAPAVRNNGTHNEWPVRSSVCVSYLAAWQDAEVQGVSRRRRPPARSRPPPAGSMRGGRRGRCASSCPGWQAEELPRAWCCLQRDDWGECSSVARKRLPPGALFTWTAGSEQPATGEYVQSGGQKSRIYLLCEGDLHCACSGAR